jgi:hypothetical protein
MGEEWHDVGWWIEKAMTERGQHRRIVEFVDSPSGVSGSMICMIVLPQAIY